MAGISKQEKFKLLNDMTNVYQNFDFRDTQLRSFTGDFADYRGRWKDIFGNEQPIVLELACGRGEYTIGLAKLNPEKNFIGIDLKGNRQYTGARYALDHDLSNVAFIRSKIELIANYFAPGEVSGIWITFADPFLNHTDANRRLTSPYFLEKYRQICAPGATINLKTDSSLLYNFSLNVAREQGLTILEADDNIYKNGDKEGPLSIKTYYEKMHLVEGKTIKFLKFLLGKGPL
jgi:tRNA (guanine-N7-)-methyltransferase